MASKKKSATSTSGLNKKIILHSRLEKPVHNLIGYSILLVLAIITMFIIFHMNATV